MARRPRLVGMNHVAVEVDDLDRALDFYGRVLDKSGCALAELREKGLG